MQNNKEFDFHNFEATLKNGQRVRLDFGNYTFREYVFDDKKITLDSQLLDENGNQFSVCRITFESVVLKDGEGNKYDFPKEYIHNMKII